MPYDPNYPPTNAAVQSAPMRAQFTGLKELIDTVSGVTSAVVDDVSTVPDGDPPFVNVGVSGSVLHLTFGLSRGNPGPEGPQGPPFANAVVDAVNTVAPDDPAQASVSFDGANVQFTFDIPAGQSGPPGEVTQAALDGAISTAAQNPDTVSTLGLTADAGYNDAQMQAVINKLDEVISALTRA
jgi:hypothetical protein